MTTTPEPVVGAEPVAAPVAAAPAAPAAAVVPEAAKITDETKYQPNVIPSEEEVPAEESAAEEVTYGVPQAPYSLLVPEDVPLSAQTEDRMALVSGFQDVAAESGLPAGIAQALLNAAVDCASMIPSEGMEPQYRDEQDAEKDMINVYGYDIAKNVAGLAQRFSKSLGPKFQSWLNETGAGNDVSVITALAFAGQGVFKLSPAEAQARIDKYRSDPKSGWNSTDQKRHRLAVAEVSILGRIAGRDADQFADSTLPAKPKEEMVQLTRTGGTATVKSEVAKMLSDPKNALNQATHRDHAAAVQRYHELIARL